MVPRINELLKSKNEILEFVREMEPKDHVVLFYDNASDKYDVLFTYLAAGFEKGHAGVYVASEDSPEKIKIKMKEYGIDVDKLMKENVLEIISYDGWYIYEGKVDPQYTINLWKMKLEKARELGFKSLRATGEMSCFLKYGFINELLAYERALHRKLELAMMGLCAYNMKQLIERNALHIFPELVRTHRYVIMIGPKGLGVTIVV